MRPLALDDFPFRAFDKLRYSDTDRQGHVNNAVFSTFLETGRTSMLYDKSAPVVEPGTAFVLARLALDYRAELHWPGEVWIGTGVLEVGRSSIKLEQAIFQDGKLCANAETVIVMVDTSTRRSRPLPDSTAERLRGFIRTKD